MSEFSIIKQYFSSLGAGKNVLLSVGDDAAALRVDEGCELIVSTDTSTAGVHFPTTYFQKTSLISLLPPQQVTLLQWGHRHWE